MTYWIGIDGGGTKTAFALSAADGVPIQTLATTGCSYQVLGVEAVVNILRKDTARLLSQAGVEWSRLLYRAALLRRKSRNR